MWSITDRIIPDHSLQLMDRCLTLRHAGADTAGMVALLSTAALSSLPALKNSRGF